MSAQLGAWELDSIQHCDLFALCDGLPDASVDMVLADLPYGTTACAWDTVIPFAPMWERFKRVIKPRGAIVLTADQPFTSALIMSNPKMYRYRWAWDKDNSAGFLNAHFMPLSTVEDVLVFAVDTPNYYPVMDVRGRSRRKGGSTLSEVYGTHPTASFNNVYFPKAVLRFSNASHVDRYHPTQKPVALFRYLIRTYTQPGELVLDPCVGSGTTALAAREEQRHWLCGDLDAGYVEVARKRLGAPFTLPMFAAVQP